MSLQEELKKREPFDSLAQEAMLAILRTSDLLENRVGRLLRDHGLTRSQYNVLRILRGEGRAMPSLEIADRMIQVAPAITRVVDQLVTAGHATKTCNPDDRRVQLVEIRPSGRRLLQRLDAPVLDLHAQLLGGRSDGQLKQLIRTLDDIRGDARAATPNE